MNILVHVFWFKFLFKNIHFHSGNALTANSREAIIWAIDGLASWRTSRPHWVKQRQSLILGAHGNSLIQKMCVDTWYMSFTH